MSTSGTTTFSRNRDQLIKSALRKVGAFESGETPDSESMNDAAEALNTMVKHWQGSGIQIWKTMESILFPQISQVRYSIGSSSTDHATESWVETAITTAAEAGVTSIILDSVTGIATTYQIGIQLDDGTFQWTTVNGAPSGTTVTLATVLTDSAAVGNLVVSYQTSLVRPLRVIDARRYNFTSAIDVPLGEMDRLEYQDMPNKTSTGAVNSFYYDRRETGAGYLYVWPAPATTGEGIKMTIAKPIEDFTAGGDDADLPQEWIRAIEWGLADEIADEYDVPEPKRSRIERRAAQYLQEANWWESELLSLEFVPDNGR
ncbi:hypothetical protein [Bradyrhizobium sp. 930_D9_N1_4]|uniref:hypothetical protein n=1 Tax=Bradyrhizobium sp. 930_D9_N1_4 TaxID=3240374 RepID=UPI003F8B675A